VRKKRTEPLLRLIRLLNGRLLTIEQSKQFVRECFDEAIAQLNAEEASAKPS
jgi:hypothetical protein